MLVILEFKGLIVLKAGGAPVTKDVNLLELFQSLKAFT